MQPNQQNQLRPYQIEGVEKLMEALLISGYAMVIAGSSRPARMI